MIKPDYLGDGVYATAQMGGSVLLTTGHHLENYADSVIVLEPEVLAALDRYRERMKEVGR